MLKILGTFFTYWKGCRKEEPLGVRQTHHLKVIGSNPFFALLIFAVWQNLADAFDLGSNFLEDLRVQFSLL
jgi:hypothetical protein